MKRLTDKEVFYVETILKRLIGNVKECKEMSEFYNEKFYELNCKLVLSEHQLEELKRLQNHIEK